MLIVGTIAAGLGLLLVAGLYQLGTTRMAGPDAKRSQLMSEESTTFTRGDLRDPAGVLDDGRKLQNALVVVLEVAAIVMAVWMTLYVYTYPGVPTAFKYLTVAALVVGSVLVGRGLYLRLGLYDPVTIRESLRTKMGAGVAEDFVRIEGALDTARGDDDGAMLDDATVGVLAAARNDQPLDRVTEWGREEGVADPETIERRAERLAQAGIVERDEDDDRLSVGPQLAGADEDQLASVTATVLN